MDRSYLNVDVTCDFPLQNLPYGVFSTEEDGHPRAGVAIGDHILDLRAAHRAGLLSGPIISQLSCFEEPTLNSFMALGQAAWAETRSSLTRLLSSQEGVLRDSAHLQQQCLVPRATARMHLPAAIGDYTDFYCCREHATNVGALWRGRDNALYPNWLHMPVGYHGRASSIVVSGTDVRRPRGQVLKSSEAGAPPCFQPSAALDFELELGFFIGPGNGLGSPLPLSLAPDHIFGYVLVNDWSARDVQKWEYVPLGPFNGKNFATTISPWIVTPAALDPFRCAAPPSSPRPSPTSRRGRGRGTGGATI